FSANSSPPLSKTPLSLSLPFAFSSFSPLPLPFPFSLRLFSFTFTPSPLSLPMSFSFCCLLFNLPKGLGNHFKTFTFLLVDMFKHWSTRGTGFSLCSDLPQRVFCGPVSRASGWMVIGSRMEVR
uniref:Uncharacterized protein n=1 Tax=Esox lucius TaxID=8010 RepID=A0AAY5L7D8_ESOLU